MDSEVLVVGKFEGGAKLIRALERLVAVSAALWLYDSELNRWQLLIVLGNFDPKTDPRVYYREIGDALSKLPEPRAVEISDVYVVGPDEPVIQALRESSLGQAANVEGVRLGGNQVGNVFIPAAYLYRLFGPSKIKLRRSGRR